MPASYSEATCTFGMIRKCTGATGRMSWNASTSSSSYTFFAGISPRTILQKMQFGSLRHRFLRAAFSSMPEMPSRRCSSASTSPGPRP